MAIVLNVVPLWYHPARSCAQRWHTCRQSRAATAVRVVPMGERGVVPSRSCELDCTSSHNA